MNTAAAKNGTREPYCPSRPPTTGPTMKPMPQAAPFMPKNFARSACGTRSATTAFAVAKVAPAKPAITRPTNSQNSVGAKPMIR